MDRRKRVLIFLINSAHPKRAARTNCGTASALRQAKALGIKDVCFAKKRGLEETQMCRSEYVYHRLRRFRVCIESSISLVKRKLGLSRRTWKGWHAFKSYVWSLIVAANHRCIKWLPPSYRLLDGLLIKKKL